MVLCASLLLKLNHLGHESIKALDESFHAVVAKNLLKHPLKPTLYDRPWLKYDYRDWQNNHVWLHKPPVPLWQMAASMAVFGVNTLALRLPSVMLATAAAWLTYAIGVELLRDRRAALIAATLQAFHPAITALVHGYVFSDHVDIAFLFWVELSVYLLIRAIRSGSMRWTLLAGIAQGIAYLSKSYPAFIVTGIALVAAVLPLLGLVDLQTARFRARHVAVLFGATLLTAAPWTLWCIVQYPREFWWEQAQVFRHLGTNVEGWAAPWDRLVFDFSLRIYRQFYPAILVAAILLAYRTVREKHIGLSLLLAWGLGVLIPHVIATSKTPTATLIGWPPFWLLLGAMIARALDGDRLCLGAWLVTMLLAASAGGTIPDRGWGYPEQPGFARIMREQFWVIIHVAGAIAAGIAAAALPIREPAWGRIRLPMVVAASGISLVLAARLAQLGWKVTQQPSRDRPSFAELGAMVRGGVPENAVVLLEINQKAEHIMAMFHLDRSVYPVGPQDTQAMAADIRAAGGLPLLVTHRAYPFPVVFDRPADGRWVYLLEPR